MDKLTRISQKGFSGSKYCQEVLIGIVDSIHSVKHSGRQGALLSLDIKKAFDSTAHSYYSKYTISLILDQISFDGLIWFVPTDKHE